MENFYNHPRRTGERGGYAEYIPSPRDLRFSCSLRLDFKTPSSSPALPPEQRILPATNRQGILLHGLHRQHYLLLVLPAFPFHSVPGTRSTNQIGRAHV